MKKAVVFILLSVFLPACVTPQSQGPFIVGKPWGGPAPYGERVHPGIDYDIPTGAPVVAVSNGKVVHVADLGADGLEIVVMHGPHFKSVYAHLGTVAVGTGQMVKRGQFLGLSGESNSYNKPKYAHLHFGICKNGPGLDCHNVSASLDPNLFWLGGQPRCFEPQTDYSVHPQNAITLPLACGEHGKTLRSATS